MNPLITRPGRYALLFLLMLLAGTIVLRQVAPRWSDALTIVYLAGVAISALFFLFGRWAFGAIRNAVALGERAAKQPEDEALLVRCGRAFLLFLRLLARAIRWPFVLVEVAPEWEGLVRAGENWRVSAPASHDIQRRVSARADDPWASVCLLASALAFYSYCVSASAGGQPALVICGTLLLVYLVLDHIRRLGMAEDSLAKLRVAYLSPRGPLVLLLVCDVLSALIATDGLSILHGKASSLLASPVGYFQALRRFDHLLALVSLHQEWWLGLGQAAMGLMGLTTLRNAAAIFLGSKLALTADDRRARANIAYARGRFSEGVEELRQVENPTLADEALLAQGLMLQGQYSASMSRLREIRQFWRMPPTPPSEGALIALLVISEYRIDSAALAVLIKEICESDLSREQCFSVLAGVVLAGGMDRPTLRTLAQVCHTAGHSTAAAYCLVCAGAGGDARAMLQEGDEESAITHFLFAMTLTQAPLQASETAVDLDSLLDCEIAELLEIDPEGGDVWRLIQMYALLRSVLHYFPLVDVDIPDILFKLVDELGAKLEQSADGKEAVRYLDECARLNPVHAVDRWTSRLIDAGSRLDSWLEERRRAGKV